MHQCVKYEVNFLTWCKKTRQERREEVCCSVCRLVFCCTKDREKHEEAEHGRETAGTARQQRQIIKGNKPIVCLSCCQVFMSGLFVNDTCNNASDSAANKFKATETAHVLITIPEWAVNKYLVPHQRKRSWDMAREDAADVEILVHPAVDKSTEDCISVQENSFTRKTGIQGILTKQRKTDLAEKRERRVTFSPVAAVALTSRLRIVKMESQKTGGDSSSDATPNLSSPDIRPKTPEQAENLIRDLRSDNSVAPIEKESAIISAFSPSLPNETSNKSADSPFVPNIIDNTDCVFSPPLPDGGSNGSPMMTPQMSSTPVNENAERKISSTLECLSEQEASRDGTAPSDGVFSSLANFICCAFQALPSVLTQFFSVINETEQNDNTQDLSSTGRHRRQRRRRSAAFTPYLPASNKRSRLHTKKTTIVPAVYR